MTSVPEPAILFEDNFSDPGFAARWCSVDLSSQQGPAQWYIRRGVLRQSSNCYTPNSHRGTLLLARAETPPPYRIRARLRSTDDDRIGLTFGYVDEREHYLFWSSASLGRQALTQIEAGRERTLAMLRRGYQISRWYQLEALVTSERAQIWIDGEPALDAPLPRIPNGQIGLYCHANEGVEVAEFSVERAIAAAREPMRLQWRVQGDLQTIVSLSNVTDAPVWVKVEAWDAEGAQVIPSLMHGLGEPDMGWRALGARRSISAVFGPPLTAPGYGHCAIWWRSADPDTRRPLLASAHLSDDQGRSWSTPVYT